MYETTYEKFTDEQLDAYLAKLDYKGTRELTLENLDELIRIHPLHIPFENLNPYYGKPVLLDKDSLFDKIIAHKRGGFCFELNGLFNVLAYSLGFDSYSCAARIIRDGFATPLHHRGTIVHLDNKLYFCDVGFGGDMMPFAVEISTEPTVKQGKTAWCEPVRDGWYVLKSLDADGNPKDMLMFGALPLNMNDFNYLCGGMLADPECIFRKALSCNLTTENGYRKIEFGKTLRIVENGESREIPVEEDKLLDICKEYFDIEFEA